MNAIIVSAIWGVVMMFCGVFVKSKSVPKYLASLGMIFLLVLNFLEYAKGKSVFGFNSKGMLHTDHFNLLFIGIIMICTLLYFFLNSSEIEKVGPHVGEYFALIFFILCGISLVATFNTLLMLFIGIEIISIPLYILTGSDKRNLKSNEAALKYFLMGAFSTGLMLMGIAFIYGGNTNATFYINQLQLGEGPMPVFIGIGLVFLLVAMSFKVSAAPFHFWTPDVYDGAPTVFTSFMSTVVKAAGFFAFVRLFENAFGSIKDQWHTLIIVILLATLFVGNITAVFQQSVKRMLAYSSIAQAGFMLFSVFALNAKAKEGLLLYSAAYSLATIGIFGVLTKMKDYTVEGFNGLASRNPFLAFAVTICLLSLTGIPLTAGFQSKFYMLMAAVENGQQFWIVIVAVLFAAISAYYYFRVIQSMYFKQPVQLDDAEPLITTFSFKLTLGVIIAMIVIIGVYPEIMIGWMYH